MSQGIYFLADGRKRAVQSQPEKMQSNLSVHLEINLKAQSRSHLKATELACNSCLDFGRPVWEPEQRRLFVQPGTEIASERQVSSLRLGQARLNLREPVSPLSDPLLAKPESGLEKTFRDPCLNSLFCI